MPEENNVDNVQFLGLGEQPQEGPSNNEDFDDQTDDNDTDTIDKDENSDENQDIHPLGNDQDTNNTDKDTDKPGDNQTDDQSKDLEEDDDVDVDDDADKDDDASDDEPELSLFESVIESSGVDFDEDEREELLDTPETEEGLNKVADRIAEKKAEQHFSSLMEQYPHTSRMLEYEMHGGDPEKYYEAYFPEQDFTQMEVEEDNMQQQKQIVAQSLQQQGLEQEDIESEIQDLEDAGLLERRAQRSLKVLRKKQEQKREEIEQEREELKQQRQQEAQQRYENTVELVKEGEIEGVEVPNKKQDEFIQYLFEPVNEQGHTQAQLDSQELGLEQRILMAYLNFSGYNLDGFIKNQSKNAGNSNLRDKLKKSENKENLKSKGNRPSEKPGNPEDIVSPFG